MNSEEAQQRSKYLDRRIREAAGLDVKPVAAVEPAKGVKRNPESAYWDGRLRTKRKSEPKHLGGKPAP
jgi:hypothetical protein